MELTPVFALIALFLLLRLIPVNRVRDSALLVLAVAFTFVFQPVVPIRNYTFFFPLATIVLTLILWAICQDPALLSKKSTGTMPDPDAIIKRKQIAIDLTLIAGTVLAIALSRFARLDRYLTAVRPPRPAQLAVPFGLSALTIIIAHVGTRKNRSVAFRTLTFVLLALLVILKTDLLATGASRLLRFSTGQDVSEATGVELRWFGFSYIAFRLMSVAIEGAKGKKFTVTPGQFLTYVCFPPTLTAGPIDRLDRFTKDLTNEKRFVDDDFNFALERITLGLLKKFILADSLSYLALNAQNALQFRSAGYAWLALYAYALQIYFDFAGYSDIAIGIARLLGIRIPENFNAPYLKRNIALFWNNWHMTLTGWIRNYCFNPLTRAMRKKKEPMWKIILIGQLVTMTLIGLWHGVTVNFLLWGLWNALGLFLHQLYADGPGKRWHAQLDESPRFARLYSVAATILTFHFVAIGWIFFTLPTPDMAFAFLTKLIGGPF